MPITLPPPSLTAQPDPLGFGAISNPQASCAPSITTITPRKQSRFNWAEMGLVAVPAESVFHLDACMMSQIDGWVEARPVLRVDTGAGWKSYCNGAESASSEGCLLERSACSGLCCVSSRMEEEEEAEEKQVEEDAEEEEDEGMESEDEDEETQRASKLMARLTDFSTNLQLLKEEFWCMSAGWRWKV